MASQIRGRIARIGLPFRFPFATGPCRRLMREPCQRAALENASQNRAASIGMSFAEPVFLPLLSRPRLTFVV